MIGGRCRPGAVVRQQLVSGSLVPASLAHSNMEENVPAIATVAVVVSPSEQPRIHTIRGALGPEIVLDEEVFRDAGLGDWLGFYDWLRTKSGEVIGVRLWIDEPSEQVRTLSRCAGVVTGELGSPLVIHLSNARDVEDHLSDDQDFGSNMLLLSADRFALTFNAPRPR